MWKKDSEVLRPLAEEYMKAAVSSTNTDKIRLWRALNHSEMERPLVIMDQLPWHELNHTGELTLQCLDGFCIDIERHLRRELYKWKHFPVDMVLDPCIAIPMAISGLDYGLSTAVERLSTSEANDVKSQLYTNLLKDEEGLSHIKDMSPVHDEALTQERMTQAEEIFRGIAPLRKSGVQMHLGIWDQITMFMGVEDVYFDFIDRPEFLHKILGRFTQSVISGIEKANQLQIHDDNSITCHCSPVFDDRLLAAPLQGKGGISQNCWAFGLAQLFTGLSPELFEEFEIPYISRMAEHYNMIYYGCCDRLDDRLDAVKKIPNLRKVSCSPWSDRDLFAEKIGKELIMSNKPNPSLISQSYVDWDDVRKDLVHTRDAARKNNVNLEYILKDVSTVANHPEHLVKWGEIAMEVVNG